MKILREPLFHFALVGVAIFVLNGIVGSEESEQSTGAVLRVTAADLERLQSVWMERWNRQPSADELRGLVADYIREEVLYREGLAMGLDRDDTIVRRRLAQKVAYLSQDLALDREPTDAELKAFFEANRAQYAASGVLSFSHVFFDPSARDDALTDAARAVDSLRESETPRARGLGDPSAFRLDYSSMTAQAIGETLGDAVRDAAINAPAETWVGPIESEHGVHLLRVYRRDGYYTPEFAEIRETVLSDWLAEESRRVDEVYMQNLLDEYAIEIDDTVKTTIGSNGATQT